MKRMLYSFAAGVILTAGILLSLAAFAQDSPLAFVRPLVVDVRQSVPVVADVTIPHEGEMITATLPLTVDVNLQVSIRGEAAAVTVLTPTQPARVSVAIPAIVPVGELIVLDDAEWRFIGAEDLGQTLDKTILFPERTTSGRFVSVTYEIRNLAGNSIYFKGIDLIDSAGRFYEPPALLQEYVSDEQQQCTIEQINSGLKKRCQVIYDIPAEATGLQAEFTNLADSNPRTQQVDLGF